MKLRFFYTLFAVILISACGDAKLSAPTSLQDTDPDGQFNFDADGQFNFDDEARTRFDYYRLGESETSELNDWVDRQLHNELGRSKARQVKAAWTNYSSYREQAQQILSAPAGDNKADALSEAKTKLLAALQQHCLDSDFSVAEKKRIDRAYELRLSPNQPSEPNQYPATGAAQFAKARQDVNSSLTTTSNPTASELMQIRRQHYGNIEPGAAARLAVLDAERERWASKLEQYRQQRDQMQQGFSGGNSDLQLSLHALAQQHFNPTELRRVQALERLEEL